MADSRSTASRSKKAQMSREEKRQEKEERRLAEEKLRAERDQMISERIDALRKVLKGGIYENVSLDDKAPRSITFAAEHLSLLANNDNSVRAIMPGNLIVLNVEAKDPQPMDRCVLVYNGKYAVAVRTNRPGVDYIRTEADASTRESADIRTGSEYKLIGKMETIIDMTAAGGEEKPQEEA